MPLEIVSKRGKILTHLHKCPICKQVKRESNEVCGYHQDHVFGCISCLQDHHLRLGIDILVDSWLDAVQAQRFEQMTRDQHIVDLDARDAERRVEQVAEIRKKAEADPEAYRPKTVEQKKVETHEKIDELQGEATVITEEEMVEEWKKIQEDERV